MFSSSGPGLSRKERISFFCYFHMGRMIDDGTPFTVGGLPCKWQGVPIPSNSTTGIIHFKANTFYHLKSIQIEVEPQLGQIGIIFRTERNYPFRRFNQTECFFSIQHIII